MSDFQNRFLFKISPKYLIHSVRDSVVPFNCGRLNWKILYFPWEQDEFGFIWVYAQITDYTPITQNFELLLHPVRERYKKNAWYCYCSVMGTGYGAHDTKEPNKLFKAMNHNACEITPPWGRSDFSSYNLEIQKYILQLCYADLRSQGLVFLMMVLHY